MSFAEKLLRLAPAHSHTVLLDRRVIGSIYYTGTTPTEAAVLGGVGLLILSLASGSPDWETWFHGSVMGAMHPPA